MPLGCFLKPWCLPICLFALKCLRSAAAETIGQFYHLPLSPISTVVIILTNHLPETLVPVISFKLSRDDYGGICFFQITFSDVTFLICFHDLLVFFIISFSGCHSCCHVKCCHKLFIFLSTHFHFLKQLLLIALSLHQSQVFGCFLSLMWNRVCFDCK